MSFGPLNHFEWSARHIASALSSVIDVLSLSDDPSSASREAHAGRRTLRLRIWLARSRCTADLEFEGRLELREDRLELRDDWFDPAADETPAELLSRSFASRTFRISTLYLYSGSLSLARLCLSRLAL